MKVRFEPKTEGETMSARVAETQACFAGLGSGNDIDQNIHHDPTCDRSRSSRGT